MFKTCIYIFITTDGIYSINPGGLQADLMGGSGGAEPPGKYIHHPGVGMGLIKAIATAG